MLYFVMLNCCYTSAISSVLRHCSHLACWIGALKWHFGLALSVGVLNRLSKLSSEVLNRCSNLAFGTGSII